MRKVLSKILLLLAAAGLLFAVAACGGGGTEETPRNNDQSNNANGGNAVSGTQGSTAGGEVSGGTPVEVSPPVPTVPMGNIHPIIDMGGREIRITAGYLNHMDGAARGAVNLEPPDPQHPLYHIHRLQYENRRRVEEQFNVTIVAVNSGGWTPHIEGFNAGQAAGQPIGEIVRAPGPIFINAIAGSQLVDLATLVHPMADDGFAYDFHTNNSLIYSRVDLNEHQWSFSSSEPVGSGAMIIVNMDLVTRLGLPDPVALYDDGNWNWDSFLNIMRLAKAQGYWGLAGNTGVIAQHFSGSNDARFVDENFNYAANHPNTVEAFQFLQDMFLEELWKYDMTVGMQQTHYQWAVDAFFDQGDAVFFAEPGWITSVDRATFNFRVLPMPLGPSNTSGTTAHTVIPSIFVIPVGIPNPEEILIIVEELYSWSIGNEWMLRESVEDGLRDRFQTEECVQRWLYHVNNTVRPELGWSAMMRETAWMWYEINWSLIGGYEDATTLLEMQRAPYQERLDNLFGHLRR
jgi:ABC-type glycerol-3-phosphate transport system substrate-binding protein